MKSGSTNMSDYRWIPVYCLRWHTHVRTYAHTCSQ